MMWLLQDSRFTNLLETLEKTTHASLDMLWGSSLAAIAAALHHATSRPVLIVTTHLDEADNAFDDLDLFTRWLHQTAPSPTPRPPTVALFPAWETKPGADGVGDEIEAERLAIVSDLHSPRQNPPPALIVAPIQALMQPVPTPEALAAHVLDLQTGVALSPENTAGWLTARGFTRLEAVEVPGDFAQRASIIDVWPAGDPEPLRLEFDLDNLRSIRRFDPASQRSDHTLQHARITASLKASEYNGQNTRNFLACLPPNTILLLDEPADIQEHARLFLSRLSDPAGMYPLEAVLRHAKPFTILEASRFNGGTPDPRIGFPVQSIQRLAATGNRPNDVLTELRELATDHCLHIFCEQSGEKDRLTEMLLEQAGQVPPNLHFHQGFLHAGFIYHADQPDQKHLLVGHHELFKRSQRRRRLRRVAGTRALDNFVDLEPGDFVVHRIHGIARFDGLQQMTQNGRTEDVLCLSFAEDVKLYVAVSQIELVHKYVGFAGKPPLSRLGGAAWTRTKEKAEEAVLEMAEELLEVQARRASLPGEAFPPDTEWQREFEESFAYVETEDQLRVIREIKKDQIAPRPMDRLLCGDVGYGKTEIAMRAAFKVVEAGKQVAVLVPTTVLAQQHLQTFSERFRDFPIRINVLNRFIPPAEQKLICRAAARGEVEILIGTHRILSRDVSFANLGLVVIDEEQRFGVEHKERLKSFRASVDVLTLTATPIPRTLHLSMMGLRDISTLTTAPLDRRAIASRVVNYDEKLIKEALLRELNREGQVFFVHNRVHDIHDLAHSIQQLVPHARIGVGHGQMNPGELEDVMTRFIQRQTDILVCTTIIESGIDIPTANTIFVNNAHDFGLSELHQLRGRVGRYKNKAHAYFLIPPDRPITPVAARRLKAIEEFSELGAGFRIAMQDLEIRGAGNILGAEQSGHLNAIGYDLYCELLEQAVKKLRNEQTTPTHEVHLELGFAGGIPRAYINATRQRMDVYRRLARVTRIQDVQQLEADLRDAFGPIPPELQILVDLAELKVAAIQLNLKSIILKAPDLVFTSDDFSALIPLLAKSPGSVRIPDDKHLHLRLPPNYLVPTTLMAVLRKVLLPQQTAQQAAQPAPTLTPPAAMPNAATTPAARRNPPGKTPARLPLPPSRP